ncbi:MAG: SLBB domain-containing protein [Bacteroidales bacterium]
MKIHQTIISVLFLGIFMVIAIAANAQVQNVTGKDLSKVKVDLLTDAQVSALVKRADLSGMTKTQLETAAKARGMQASEIVKLMNRIEKLNISTNITTDKQITDRTRDEMAEDSISEREITQNEKIFGFSLFTNKKLTFEPSINIARPKNYQLGPDDDIIIDIWGASQATYEQKISPEGNIIISNLGPIYLNGMTIEDATGKIKKELSTIYAGLYGGNTFLKVSLGSVRSIKVNIVGEVAMPGTYTLSSLASVFNALYAASGPAENGSLRNVKIIRDNKTVAELDFYEFLTKGEQPGNMRLQDEDVVFVSPYTNRVEIKGEVKRPGLFDMKPSESLKDLIYFAGNFTGKAYSQRIKTYRTTGKEYKVLDVPVLQRDTFKLHNGDEITVDTILSRFENRVQINGAVYRPGVFAIDSVTTLKQLIKKAEGLRGDVFKNRILVYRTKEDLNMEVIPFDLSNLMQNDEDFTLQREDSVVIPSIFDITEDYSIQISGEISKPGKYPFVLNSTVEDIIIQAGGILESASFARLEVARRIKDNIAVSTNEQIAEIYQFPISKDLKLSDSASKFTLQPFDMVFIRKSPGYLTQELINIEGEVLFPGSYCLTSKSERISDLVKRAGNFTPEAYPEGARLIRKLTPDQFLSKAIEQLKQHMEDTTQIEYKTETESTIGIDLEKIMKKTGSAYDLYLRKGDVLKIPKKLTTLSLTGALLSPGMVRYAKGKRMPYYISNAGGYTDDAKSSKLYVVYANGMIKSTHKILFFNKYPRVEPGSEIVVAHKSERKGRMTTAEAVGFGTAMASMALIIISIINALK